MSCKYCYAPANDSDSAGIMAFRTFQRSVSLAFNYAKNHGSLTLDVLFHGGEPLLWGFSKYARVLEYLSELEGNVYIKIKLQTNGTLLNDDFADLFKKYGVHASVSLDGPKEIHDALRVYPDSKGSYDDVMEAVRRLKKYQKSVGAIAVVTKHHLGKEQEFYDFFREHNLGLQPNPLIVWGRAEAFKGLGVTPQEYLQFMERLFGVWIRDDDPLNIPVFVKIVQSVVLGRPISYCQMSAGCAKTKQFLSVDWDGTISLCNRTASLGVPELVFGNVRAVRDLEDAFAHPNFTRLVARADNLRNTQCSSCSLYVNNFCGGGGGCVFQAYVSGDLNAVPPSCDLERRLVETVARRVLPYKLEAKKFLERCSDNEC